MSKAQPKKCLAGPVGLNVGGQIYTTSLSTLTKYSESTLGTMFSERHSLQQDANGNYFIDRDGSLFRYVLEFLRNGQLQALENKRDLRLLLKEAEFFGITSLEEAVKQQIRSGSAEQRSQASDETEVITIKYDGGYLVSASGRVITMCEVFHVSNAETERLQIVPYSYGQSDRPDSLKTGKLTPRSSYWGPNMVDVLEVHGFVKSHDSPVDDEWVLSRTASKQQKQ